MLRRFLQLLLCYIAVAGVCHAETVGLNASARAYIGDLLYLHECGNNPEKLTSWNKGEDFASLGIGHFIWYPAAAKEKRFTESFPALLDFIRERGVISMPAWLSHERNNPWPNRASFMAAISQPRMIQLRQWLEASRNEQVLFIQARLDASLPRMITGLSTADANHVQQQYARMVDAPVGYFVLMDYVNFKGEGVNPKERYQGQGWGLQQVLLGMHGNEGGRIAVAAFTESAKQQLRQRVQRSPPQRHESRWLLGWENRLNHYLQEADRFLSQ